MNPDVWAGDKFQHPEEGRGPRLTTNSRRMFYPVDPDPESIRIEDIAHASSMICRWNGHCDVFYSVGQHAIAVCDLVRKAGGTLGEQKQALMHDAAEAYVGDMPTPLKRYYKDFCAMEDNLLEMIAEKFGFDPHLSPLVHDMDWEALQREAYHLFNPPHDTVLKEDHARLSNTQSLYPLPPLGAKHIFLEYYRELFQPTSMV